MRAKRAKTAKMLNDAWLHLAGYRREIGNNVAQNLLMDAERRVLNGFGPVPQQDCDNLIAIEKQYSR